MLLSRLKATFGILEVLGPAPLAALKLRVEAEVVRGGWDRSGDADQACCEGKHCAVELAHGRVLLARLPNETASTVDIGGLGNGEAYAAPRVSQNKPSKTAFQGPSKLVPRTLF